MAMADDDRKKKNLRLALILASAAVALFIGFLAKTILLNG